MGWNLPSQSISKQHSLCFSIAFDIFELFLDFDLRICANFYEDDHFFHTFRGNLVYFWVVLMFFMMTTFQIESNGTLP